MSNTFFHYLLMQLLSHKLWMFFLPHLFLLKIKIGY